MFEGLKSVQQKKGKTMKTGPRQKKGAAKKNKANKTKELTKWEDGRVSKEEIKALDRSEDTVSCVGNMENYDDV